MRAMGDVLRYVIFALLLLSITGCAAASLPSGAQLPCRELRTIYIVNQGRHAGLVFEAADLAAAVPALDKNLRSEGSKASQSANWLRFVRTRRF